MRIAYFDCFSGASGDMILGACLNAGLEIDRLREDLALLGVEGYQVEAQAIRKQGFGATQFEVKVDSGQPRPHRHLRHILEILSAARLPEGVRQQATAIFTRLAEAEARVHGTTVEKVHFHEVGAIDAIVDIVGACLALDRLGVQHVHVSPIPTGSGTVKCDHGLMPVPAPATAELLKGVPLAACDEPGELTTPTGAAILTTLAQGYGGVPAMTVRQIGIGAGRRDGATRPNILRLLIGDEVQVPGQEDADQVLVLEANLDDATGQVVAEVCQLLLDTGARDVFTTPIYMKKGRPGTLITVLAPPALRDAVEEILFTQTTTFGVRSHLAERRTLARTLETVTTPFGEVRVKVGRRGGQVVRATPEFEDCRAAARCAGRPVLEVIEAACQAWRQQGHAE